MSAIRLGAAVLAVLAPLVVGFGAATYGFETAEEPPALEPVAVPAPISPGGPPGSSLAGWTPKTRPTTSPTRPAASRAASPPSRSWNGAGSRRASSSPQTSAAAPVADCAPGALQREVETSLAAIGGYGAISVNGLRSAADCAAIKRFQHRFGIQPASGQADAATADVARRIAASLAPSGQAKCGAGPELTACVDLTQQTMWVVRDGRVLWGPTVVRTGFRGYDTPAGTYKINKRALTEWSDPYEVWLPYWQRFHQGMGFHQTTTYLHDPELGSHGCVNLLRVDAERLWHVLAQGTTVRTFGRRAGT